MTAEIAYMVDVNCGSYSEPAFDVEYSSNGQIPITDIVPLIPGYNPDDDVMIETHHTGVVPISHILTEILTKLGELNALMPRAHLKISPFGTYGYAPADWNPIRCFIGITDRMNTKRMNIWHFVREAAQYGYLDFLNACKCHLHNVHIDNTDKNIERFRREAMISAVKHSNVFSLNFIGQIIGFRSENDVLVPDLLKTAAEQNHGHIIAWLYFQEAGFTKRKMQLYAYRRFTDKTRQAEFQEWLDERVHDD